MTDFLDPKVFKSGIEKLEAAFRQSELSQASVRIYQKKLNYVSNEAFTRAVDKIIINDDYFPSIARLTKATKETPTHPEWL